jgi:GNAT superfamily N-acetyltransferase
VECLKQLRSDPQLGTGIGSALVKHVEQWATRNGAKRLSVTSGMHRKATHEFYEKRDYENTGLRFTKKLVGDRS